MMPEFEDMLAAVRADCAARPLAPPDRLRRLGDRRVRRQRVAMVTAVTGVAVVATALIAPGRGHTPVPSGPASSAAIGSATSPGPAVTTPAGPAATTTATGPGTSSAATSPGASAPACGVDQIGPTPGVHTGVAAGSLGLRVVITNQSRSACEVSGFPVLWFTNPGKVPAVLPVSPGADPQTIVLGPGGQAEALLSWTNGYGGYQSAAPECHQKRQYQDLALAIGAGRIPVPGATIEVVCGDISVMWMEVPS